ncbi:MAG: aspartate--tRNA ligase [bacterium]|nr:aspartate--tRNA ligase [bacterium]
MKRIQIREIKGLSFEASAEKEEIVKISGWVDVRRDHGKLIFIDLRDATGKVQLVVLPSEKEAHQIADTVRPEWVIEVEGEAKRRPDNMANADSELGGFEVLVKKISVLNEAKTPPFEIGTDGYEVGEEVRLKYRYLDLRRERLQKNIRDRYRALKFIRDYLTDKDFVEIETPILTKSTPEGARDFVVPSRTQKGKFYALPQSPQQYKQLLMASGFEKYFQIAKCMRDEDTRSDRQPEFTQLDMEMAFTEKEDIMNLNEALIIGMVKELMPEKKIKEIPFPRLPFKEVMEKYGTDRPDLREDKNDPNELAFCWVVDFPFFEKNDKGGWTFTHNPFSAPAKEYEEMLMKKENVGEIIATQYDLVLNGFEIAGGSIRNHRPEALKKVFEILGFSDEEIGKNFGHMLSAFEYGAPPHGGIAFGLDRIVAILKNEPSIREVIAFPKTGDSRDLMMDAPSEISQEQLDELGIEIKKNKD